MTKQEQQARLNDRFYEKQDLLNSLQGSDYIEHKIVDAICAWAKGSKPTVSGLVSSILSFIGDDAQYAGFPESKEVLRSEINSAEAEIAELEQADIEEEVSAE